MTKEESNSVTGQKDLMLFQHQCSISGRLDVPVPDGPAYGGTIFGQIPSGLLSAGDQKNVTGHLCSKVRCGICGYAMAYTKGKPMYFHCRTPHMNAAYTCAG